ncbi:hypothetical protein Hdeb2414_s0020g00559441 [Helianthus debilis subsp. tardiflorus]
MLHQHAMFLVFVVFFLSLMDFKANARLAFSEDVENGEEDGDDKPSDFG